LRADVEKRIGRLQRRRDDLTGSIEAAEARIAQIDATFCEDGYYERTAADEVAALERERGSLQSEVDRHMDAWTGVEREIEQLSGC
jgi:chromosome segregation ATPase